MEHCNNLVSIGKDAASLGRGFWSFSYPHQVVSDPNMTVEEKRGILAAWASDENAVESFPLLRHPPGTPHPVTFSSIMDARLQLDRVIATAGDNPPRPPVTKCPPRHFGEAA